MVVVGGMASIWGSVVGAALLSLLPELLARYEGSETIAVRSDSARDDDRHAARDRADARRRRSPARAGRHAEGRQPHQAVRRRRGRVGRELRRRRGRGPRGHRAERRGQDHALQPDHRRLPADRRVDRAATAPRSRGCRPRRSPAAASRAPSRTFSWAAGLFGDRERDARRASQAQLGASRGDDALAGPGREGTAASRRGAPS